MRMFVRHNGVLTPYARSRLEIAAEMTDKFTNGFQLKGNYSAIFVLNFHLVWMFQKTTTLESQEILRNRTESFHQD